MPSPAIDTSFSFCNDRATAFSALEDLKACQAVIFDAEGENLGEPGGTLSIVSFRTICEPSSQKSLIIDILALDDATKREVIDFLVAPQPVKIVFDGRMDFTEIFYTFNVSLPHESPGVLDLQLADIYSRRLRGEINEERLKRLLRLVKWSGVYPKNGATKHLQYVELLNGLEGCLQEHGLIKSKAKEKIDHSQWLLRPLPEIYLKYAATDVALIGMLYQNFLEIGYLPQSELDALHRVSLRYVSIWIGIRNEESLRDAFRSHPILPLGIMTPPFPLTAGELQSCTVKSCDKCRREIPSPADGFYGSTCAVSHILKWRRPSKRDSGTKASKQNRQTDATVSRNQQTKTKPKPESTEGQEAINSEVRSFESECRFRESKVVALLEARIEARMNRKKWANISAESERAIKRRKKARKTVYERQLKNKIQVNKNLRCRLQTQAHDLSQVLETSADSQQSRHQKLLKAEAAIEKTVMSCRFAEVMENFLRQRLSDEN